MKNKILFVALTLIFISGCAALQDSRIRLSYSSISSIQPKNNIIVKVNAFVDKRTISDSVGDANKRWIKVIPENSVTEWVTDALKAELVNLGYTISDQENITNVIDGTVFDVFCDTYMSLTYNGRIGIKVILKKNGIVALERNYSVNKTCDMLWSITSAQLAKTLEMTLQETLKQAVSDINKE